MRGKRTRKTRVGVFAAVLAAVLTQRANADFKLGEDLIDRLLPDHSLTSTISAADAADSIERFRELGVVITGLGALTCVFFLALSITKLGAAGDNEMARRRAIAGLATSSIAVVILGGLSAYLGFFWKFL